MVEKILIISYHVISLGILLGLSIYDYKHLKINKPLFYAYIPISILSIYPNLVFTNFNIQYVLMTSIVSAAILFAAFFAIALFSGNKLGGGDVKLIPFIGFAYGLCPVTVLLVMAGALLILVLTAKSYSFIAKKQGLSEEEIKKKRINGPHPAIPYMFLGCLVGSVCMLCQYL